MAEKISDLPRDVTQKLAELDLELSEGDITQKGYDKKKARILAAYRATRVASPGVVPSNMTRAPREEPGPIVFRVPEPETDSSERNKKAARRLTRDESRFHSEVRTEAVLQALKHHQQGKLPVPMPSKRMSALHTPPLEQTPGQAAHPTVSTLKEATGSSDDDSSVFDEENTSSLELHQPRQSKPSVPSQVPPASQRRELRSPGSFIRLQPPPESNQKGLAPPDITHHIASELNRHNHAGSVRIPQSNPDPVGTLYCKGKVSTKIQQLLNTLKRPKRKPLPDYFKEENSELEVSMNDPDAPKPEGNVMKPTDGGAAVIPSGLPRNLISAIQRYGTSSFPKASAVTMLDIHGKITTNLSYGKLHSKVMKIAYCLLNKLGTKTDPLLRPGDKIALVYPNSDPVSYMCAFYGCIAAGLVPVSVEVPTSKRDAGTAGMGFLLRSLKVSVALTSEMCHRTLPREPSGEVGNIKGWSKLMWFCPESFSHKPPKEWKPPATEIPDHNPAYVEYTTAKDGSVMGVTISNLAMISHCRTLTQACCYTEGEVMVCVLDFRREMGLWHGILSSVFNGMHVIFVPYSLMKTDPASWLKLATRNNAAVGIVKSRDMHWGMLAKKDHKDIDLKSLRLLLVADGANPWSLTTCDSFVTVFQSKGLESEAVCPCASSAEALTVSLRRPGRKGGNQTGRGVLSMQGLSYGVVRVEDENSLMSLTLQDCGQVLPGANMVVVKIEGDPQLCKTDEVGELCLSANYTGSYYWGLKGFSNHAFRVQPLDSQGSQVGPQYYVRTGLIGFLGPGGLVFICGSRQGLMAVSNRRHNTDDIIATVLAVEPNRFIYRGRIAVFSIPVLCDERICIVAEQRPDSSEEESFQWMSKVLQAVDTIHQVGIYCLALVPPNYLPRSALGGIHIHETMKKLQEGNLHPANVLMCPHTCVLNLPQPREDTPSDVGPSAMFVGSIVQGARLAHAQGHELTSYNEEDQAKKHQFLSEVLRWRANSMPEHEIFTVVTAKGAPVTLTCSQLHRRAERVATLILEKGKRNVGDHVALVYPPSIDLVAAFYGCLYVGCVPIIIRPPHPHNLPTTLPTLKMIVEASNSTCILTNSSIIKSLRSKEANSIVESKSWPVLLDTTDISKKKSLAIYMPPSSEMLCYLDFSVSTTGMLAGIKMTHASVLALCRSIKLQCEFYPSRNVVLCLDPYSGLAAVLWTLVGVYSGHNSILVAPSELERDPTAWLTAVSQYKVRDTFCSYGVMEMCTRGLGTTTATLKQRGVNLSSVRTCIVVAEERPRIQLMSSFTKVFSTLGLSPRAVSTTFGCRVNTAMCLQGPSCPDPSEVYVDTKSLRYDRVSILEKGSPNSLCLKESGKLLPGVKVVIANPDTKGQCADSSLGEIWVSCPHDANGYFAIYGDECPTLDHFDSHLATGDTLTSYARTGYLGFIMRTEKTQADGERHDAIFIVGALDEAIVLRGVRYHPIDIENSVMRSHRKISECAVFTWTNLLVVVVELDGHENEALDVIPLVTNAILEESHLIVGVVVIVDPGVIPINSRGEKQRMHLRDGFIGDHLDPIYVAYNM
ncbi:disco-interacting protein 2 homolog C-like isoform X2 [Watersipora subatra]|uniref:disco-interacting protein 2 homolog C-like isoform X2 n=1 Tax=Watersipora subatra TaxID=2589382 RepID=UPI00355B3F58